MLIAGSSALASNLANVILVSRGLLPQVVPVGQLAVFHAMLPESFLLPGAGPPRKLLWPEPR